MNTNNIKERMTWLCLKEGVIIKNCFEMKKPRDKNTQLYKSITSSFNWIVNL